MDREIFGAGVAPGSPATVNEVKLLICHMLAEAGGEMPFEMLHGALREDGLVNYFELTGALGQLCETGHLLREERGEIEYYRSTELGGRTARELSAALPAAAREKAAAAARRALLRERRLAEVRADIAPRGDGWLLTLALPDAEAELLSLQVFAPTRQECERLRRRFLNDPVYIYKGVVALLSGRRDVLGEPLPEGEELF